MTAAPSKGASTEDGNQVKQVNLRLDRVEAPQEKHDLALVRFCTLAELYKFRPYSGTSFAFDQRGHARRTDNGAISSRQLDANGRLQISQSDIRLFPIHVCYSRPVLLYQRTVRV